MAFLKREIWNLEEKIYSKPQFCLTGKWKMNYEIKKIWGIDCIFAPMQEGNSLTIEISVNAGSEYETQKEAGISHVLEHMFFKGWKKRTTPKAVATEMDKIWAEFNASTGKSLTSYYIKCAPQFAQVSLELLADMMIDAQFAPEELEREKGVIIQELKMYEDNPMVIANEKWALFFFWENSYGRPIIGYESTIQSFTREDIFAYKKALYTKDNLLITIAGKIEDQARLEEQIALLFASLPWSKTRNKPVFHRNLPEKKSEVFVKGTEQNHLIIALPWFTAYQEERYAARILMTILGGNMSSRLFQEIREKLGVCYYIWAIPVSGEEYGLFMIRSGLSKEHFEFWVQEIHRVLDEIIAQGITQEEFDNAKSYFQGNLQMGIESSDEMANFLSSQRLTYQKIMTLDDVLAKYEAISKQEVEAILPKLEKEQRWTFYIE